MMPDHNKNYGLLSAEQFRGFVSHLPEMRGQMKELPELMRNHVAKLAEVLGERLS